MDGVALLRALRAHDETRSVPVVLLSARAGEESVLAGLDTGADDYLVKPFSARELLSRVAVHLEMAKIRKAAADALERKNKELEAFNYSVSHDLRAPVRAIEGFSAILIEEYADRLDAQGKEFLGHVRDSARRMNGLIDDMLRLSKLERAEMRCTAVDLSEMARRIGQTLRTANPGHPVELIVQPGLVAHADPNLLQILLENLLGNAWKFTTKTASPRVECGAADEDGVTTYYVKDNGAGFEPSHAHRLFAPFRRLHSDKDFPGTGVGLATVSRVVDRHGGRVWAEAAVGAGATIFWTLPK
jgi:light-regulated signal transduction histidine kinase (bacteriophytochrome)